MKSPGRKALGDLEDAGWKVLGCLWRVLNRRVAQSDLIFERCLWLLGGGFTKGLKGTTWDTSWVTLWEPDRRCRWQPGWEDWAATRWLGWERL